MSTIIAHDGAATASLFAGFLASIERDPARWRWPDSSAQYLRYRIETLTAELVQTGATGAEVAA